MVDSFLNTNVILFLSNFVLDNLKMVHSERGVRFRTSKLYLYASDHSRRCQLETVPLPHQFSPERQVGHVGNAEESGRKDNQPLTGRPWWRNFYPHALHGQVMFAFCLSKDYFKILIRSDFKNDSVLFLLQVSLGRPSVDFRRLWW